MEQTFKARNPQLGVWLFAIGIIACIAISFITIQAIWIGTACIGPSVTIYFSQTSCKYIVKKNGDLQIVNDFFRQKRTFSHITVYSPCLGHAENKDQTRHRVCHDRSPITPGTDKSPAKDESRCKSKELYLRQDSQRKNQSPI